MKNPHFLQSEPSPTLSDNSKRLYVGTGMEQDFDSEERFQKMRLVDSPTGSNGGMSFQVASPQYVNIDMNNKASPKPEKRSVSPKAIFPASIQKYLNGKGQMSIDQAVEKLKSPSSKAHKEQLDKMKLLGMFQQQEVEGNIVFRKTHSNTSPTMSPPHSGPPIGSPMVVSPKHSVTAQNTDNIVMTFDDDAITMQSPQPSVYSEPAVEKPRGPSPTNQQNQQNVANWMSHMMNQRQMPGNFPQQQMQMQMQMQQQNFGNAANNNMVFQNQTQNQNQMMGNVANMGGNMGQVSTANQGNAVDQQAFNIQWLQANNSSPQMNDEGRGRTTSFMRDDEFTGLGGGEGQNSGVGMMGSYKMLADSQLNAIQSIMQAKRTISPVEPNRTMMQYFQKRNSNPENNMMRSQMQQQPPLYQSQNSIMDQNVMRKFSGNDVGTQPQQFIPWNTNNNQFMGFQNQPSYMGVSNNNFQQMNIQQQQQQQLQQFQQQQQQQFSSQELDHRMSPSEDEMMQGNQQGMMGQNQQYQGNMDGGFPSNNTDWASSNSTNLLDPEAFFDKGDSEDFDMNIIPTDLDFIPSSRPCIDGLESEFNEQFIMPEVDRNAFNNGPNDLFRTNT